MGGALCELLGRLGDGGATERAAREIVEHLGRKGALSSLIVTEEAAAR